MTNQTIMPSGQKSRPTPANRHALILIFFGLLFATTQGCSENPSSPGGDNGVNGSRSPRLALWLAKKNELIEHQDAAFDLVMTAWFEPAEAEAIRDRHPTAKLLAGLTLNWISSAPDWQTLLVTVANNGDANGPLQIKDDMFLMYDDDDDGVLDTPCTFPGWEDPVIYAMDPRHAGWQELILSFYDVVAAQPQHNGLILDMVDAYSFCEGSWSGGVPTPLDASAWVAGQEQLLRALRERITDQKWIVANAGCGFLDDSPFPQYLNGFLLENALGAQCGLGMAELLAAAQDALVTTSAPHIVVYAADTDDTGQIDHRRLRTGLVASLMMDHSYFAYDFGPRDHGGVTDYWFPEYYEVELGEPLGAFSLADGVYRRDFEHGVIVAAVGGTADVSLTVPHIDVATGSVGTDFSISPADARIFLREN